jgi:hypothetical protein
MSTLSLFSFNIPVAFYFVKNLPIEQEKLLFMHDIAYTYVPKSFNNTWTKNNQLELDMNLEITKNIFFQHLGLNYIYIYIFFKYIFILYHHHPSK